MNGPLWVLYTKAKAATLMGCLELMTRAEKNELCRVLGVPPKF